MAKRARRVGEGRRRRAMEGVEEVKMRRFERKRATGERRERDREMEVTAAIDDFVGGEGERKEKT